MSKRRKRVMNSADWILWRRILHTFNLSIEEAQGAKREHRLAWRRQLAMYFMRRLTKDELSYETLERLFRHHRATMMYGDRLVEARIKQSPIFAARIAQYEHDILVAVAPFAEFYEGEWVGCAS